MQSVEQKITIVGGIANIAAAVNAELSRKQLASILTLLGQRTAKGNEYTDVTSLIKKAVDLYAQIDESTADNILAVYRNIAAPTPNEAAAE